MFHRPARIRHIVGALIFGVFVLTIITLTILLLTADDSPYISPIYHFQ